jgi:hypothetical protein
MTDKTLVVSADSRIVLRVPGALGPSLVVEDGRVVVGCSGAGVSAAAVRLAGQDVGALMAQAAASPGIDPAVPLRPEQIADGSVGLERLQQVPAAKGGTGRQSFPPGEVVLASGGGLHSDPRLRWDDDAKELVVSGGLSVGGVPFSP